MKQGNPFQPGRVVIIVFTAVMMAVPVTAQERFRRSPPYPEALDKLELPTQDTIQLSNGLTLSVIPKTSLPLISLRLIILAGETLSPEKLPGTAGITAAMITRGTSEYSSQELADAIESMGGRLSVSTNLDYSEISFVFLEEFLDQALEVLSGIILNPAFSRREIENVKRTVYYDLIDKANNPSYVAKRLLFSILFKGHPYQKGAFNESHISPITHRDIYQFYDTYYRPNNAILVLTGNLNLSLASRKVSHNFNTWRRKEVEKPFIPVPNPQNKVKICFVDKPSAPDATIMMGNIVMPINHPDVFPFMVLNQVLGGTPTSRLFLNLRESKRFAYEAFSDLEFYRRCGIFLIRARVLPDTAHHSIEECLKELREISREKSKSYDIEQAKSYLIGNFPLNFETYGELTDQAAEQLIYGLGREHWNKYYDTIMGVNAEEVFDAAGRYPLETPVVIVVGDKTLIIDNLSQTFEEVEIYNAKGDLLYVVKKGETTEE